MNSKRKFSRRLTIFGDIVAIAAGFAILVIGLTLWIEIDSEELLIMTLVPGIFIIIIGIFDLSRLSRAHLLKQSKELNTKRIEYYDEILMDDSNDIKVLIEKGATLIDLERYKDAIECFNRALEIEPNNLEATARKRFALEKLKKYENVEK
jgi:tetratricopeptide (TPR) repeat protein